MLHQHHFDQDEQRGGETRTKIVVALTAVTMVVEIVAGLTGDERIAVDGAGFLADGATVDVVAD